ncbi:MAG: hypothetical protein HKN03_01470, partial [Acidimicrobiales bacterium]|nr:hypothetical protein [Acidimicrobiales bacterium]
MTIVLSAILVVSALAGVPPAGADPALPEGFSYDLVATGFVYPTAVAIAPDGQVFIAEKAGRVRQLDSPNDSTPELLIDLREQVHNHNDRGLTGLAVDPGFPSRPFIYLGFALDRLPQGGAIPAYGSGSDYDPCPDSSTTGCPIRSRVLKLDVNTLAQTILFEGHCQQFPFHTFGDIEFDHTGALVASFGDGAAASFSDHGNRGNPCGDPGGDVGTNLTAPTTEGGQARSQDLLTRADDTDVAGSIVRVDPDTFAPLPSNPLAGDSETNVQRIIATGFRNPYRLAIDPQTGQIFAGNVGGAGHEEIQQIDAGQFGNSGWPCYEGPGTTQNTFWLQTDICTTLIDSGDHAPPLFSWTRNDTITAGEPCPVGGLSVSGLAMSRGGFGPPALDGALFFTDYTRDCIWYLPPGPNGPDAENPILFASDVGALVDLQMVDDELWLVDIASGTVSRITSEDGQNQAPSAVISASTTSGPAPLEISFDASGSSDPNTGDTLIYEWDFDDDGAIDATGISAVRTFTTSKVVRLTVTDQGGLADTATVTISIGVAPDVVVSEPASGRTFRVGATVPVAASATAGGVEVPSSDFEWELLINHCIPDGGCHTHGLDAIEGATGTFTMPDHEYPSSVEARLTVSGDGGTATTATAEAAYQTVGVSIASDPPGASVQVGSTAGTTPFVRTVARGGTTDLSVEDPVIIGSDDYLVDGWTVDGIASGQLFSIQLNPTANTQVALQLRPSAPIDSQRPSTPTGLTSVMSGPDVRLTWNASTDNVGVVGYNVYRSDDGGLGPLLTTSAESFFTDGSVDAAVTYTYAVRAVDAAGNIGWRSNLSTIDIPGDGVPDTERPQPPRQHSAVDVGNGIQLSWQAGTDNVGVTGYQIFRSSDGGLGPVLAVVDADPTTYLDTTAVAGTEYTYALRSVDAAGNLSWRSGFFTGVRGGGNPDTTRPT